ncbi:MAG TPA: hypothetical protein PLA88_08365 [Bacteroidales bacterium]|nr:hypothetical protein [Bacteroidales bacterium]
MNGLRLWILRKSAVFLTKALLFFGAGSIWISCTSNSDPATGAAPRNDFPVDSAMKENRSLPVIQEAIYEESDLVPTLYGVVPVYNPDIQPAVDYGVLPDYRPSVDDRPINEKE